MDTIPEIDSHGELLSPDRVCLKPKRKLRGLSISLFKTEQIIGIDRSFDQSLFSSNPY